MTIPSRPAPAPPGSSAQCAAAGANASLEQLRIQLQQQQNLQQQAGGIQRITIKLPPPPKGPNGSSTSLPLQKRNSSISYDNSTTAITRKFPPARYSPATNWNDSPFDGLTNGSVKRNPPPRPPPPKVNGRKPNAPPPPATNNHHSHNIISNIFHRKKNTKAPIPNKVNSASAEQNLYGISSRGAYGNTNTINSSSTTSSSFSSRTQTNSFTDWNAAWKTTANVTTTLTSSHTNGQTTTTETQLISFDSPPSSPTFTQKSNSDCVSVDSFSSDSNFSSPNNGSVSQPESGFEDDFGGLGSTSYRSRSRPMTASPLDPWESVDPFGSFDISNGTGSTNIGTAPVRNVASAYSSRNQQSQGVNDNPLCNGKSLLPPPSSLTMPTIIKPKISQKPKAPKPPVLPKPTGFYNSNILDSDLPTPPSPPMPKGAAPQLFSSAPAGGQTNGTISLLDVISGKVDAMALSNGSTGFVEEDEKPYGFALYDFEGAEEGDLPFRENEKIYLLEKVSEEWYRGRTKAGCEGIFPGNYIDIRVPLAEESSVSASCSSSSSSQSSGYVGNGYQRLPAVRCLYDFPADVAGDLELKENDYVTIHYRINEDWLFGECNGKQGQFPANFLEYIPENIPYMP